VQIALRSTSLASRNVSDACIRCEVNKEVTRKVTRDAAHRCFLSSVFDLVNGDPGPTGKGRRSGVPTMCNVSQLDTFLYQLPWLPSEWRPHPSRPGHAALVRIYDDSKRPLSMPCSRLVSRSYHAMSRLYCPSYQKRPAARISAPISRLPLVSLPLFFALLLCPYFVYRVYALNTRPPTCTIKPHMITSHGFIIDSPSDARTLRRLIAHPMSANAEILMYLLAHRCRIKKVQHPMYLIAHPMSD